MKFVIEKALLLTDLAFGSRLWQYQPYDILLAHFQQEKPMLAENKSLEAPGGALMALNCPDEPHLGPHLPLPTDQETHVSMGKALSPVWGMLEESCLPAALACLAVQLAPVCHVSWDVR